MTNDKIATITFRPDSETDKMIDDLIVHFQKESVGKITRSDILRKGIKDLHVSVFRKSDTK